MPKIMKSNETYTYVELLVDRGILRQDSKVVEGCVGNTGWAASLRVAQILRRGGEYYMVESDPEQSRQHKQMFKRGYNPDPTSRDLFLKLFSESVKRDGLMMDIGQIKKESGLPKFEWVVGFIEEQTELIRGCDALLFHNYVPGAINGAGEKEIESRDGLKIFFEKIIGAEPKTIGIYLPNFKMPEKIAAILESLNIKCEIFDKIDYAGNIEAKKRDKWIGKAIIATLRS